MAPRIVITIADPARANDAALAERRNRLYADAIARHGGEPVLLSAASPEPVQRAMLDEMAGLLLSGGVDIDPARYGGRSAGSDVDAARDTLEARAWATADRRSIPVFGICRGLQAINVFLGGRLVADVRGHAGPSWGSGPALRHPLRVVPGTRLARILFPTNVRGGVVEVNSYHRQGVRPADLAPGLIASGTASSPEGELVEAVETRSGRFIVALQSHPERPEGTPPAFERLFAVFVDACRGPATSR
jgi:putative glutamine amidotransferase